MGWASWFMTNRSDLFVGQSPMEKSSSLDMKLQFTKNKDSFILSIEASATSGKHSNIQTNKHTNI